jgi:hypothetical protein
VKPDDSKGQPADHAIRRQGSRDNTEYAESILPLLVGGGAVARGGAVEAAMSGDATALAAVPGLRRLAQALRLARFAGLLAGVGLVVVCCETRDVIRAAAGLVVAAVLLPGVMIGFSGLGAIRAECPSHMGRRYLSCSRGCMLLIPFGATSLLDTSLAYGLSLVAGTTVLLAGVAGISACLGLRELSGSLGTRHLGAAQSGSAIRLLVAVLVASAAPVAMAVREGGPIAQLAQNLAVASGVVLVLFRLPLGWMLELTDGIREAAEALSGAPFHSSWADFDARLRERQAREAVSPSGFEPDGGLSVPGRAVDFQLRSRAEAADEAGAEEGDTAQRVMPIADTATLRSALGTVAFGMAAMRAAGTAIFIGGLGAALIGEESVPVWLALSGLSFVAGILAWLRGLAFLHRVMARAQGRRFVSFSRACLLLVPVSLLALFDPTWNRGLACAALAVATLYPVALVGTGLALRDTGRDIGMDRVGAYCTRRSLVFVVVVALLSIGGAVGFYVAIAGQEPYRHHAETVLGVLAVLSLLLYRLPLSRLHDQAEALADAVEAGTPAGTGEAEP